MGGNAKPLSELYVVRIMNQLESRKASCPVNEEHMISIHRHYRVKFRREVTASMV